MPKWNAISGERKKFFIAQLLLLFSICIPSMRKLQCQAVFSTESRSGAELAPEFIRVASFPFPSPPSAGRWKLP